MYVYEWGDETTMYLYKVRPVYVGIFGGGSIVDPHPAVFRAQS